MDENGNMAGKTKYAKCGMFQTFNEILNEMLTSGRITKVSMDPARDNIENLPNLFEIKVPKI